MKRFSTLTLGAMLLFCAWGIYQATRPPRPSRAAFSQLPPQAQKQRRAEAQRLVQNIEEIARQARQNDKAHVKKPFVIQASEEQLNTLLQDRLRTEKFPISDLSVALSSNQLTLQGTAKYSGVDWPATISGTLQAQNGALRYQIESLSVSGLPAPSALRDKAQKAIENGLQKAFANQQRARIDAVEITPGKLTLRGQTG